MDDLLISVSDENMIIELKTMLQSHFKLKNLGNLSYFLGLEVACSSSGIILNQRKYALELITKAGLLEAKSATTPMSKTFD